MAVYIGCLVAPWLRIGSLVASWLLYNSSAPLLPTSWIHISGQKSTGEAASVNGIGLSPCGDVCGNGLKFRGPNMHQHAVKVSHRYDMRYR